MQYHIYVILTLQHCISSIRSNQFHVCGELKGTTNLYLWRLLHMYVQHFALFICVNWVWQKTRESHSLSSSTLLYLFGKAPQRIWLKLNRVLCTYVKYSVTYFFENWLEYTVKIFEHIQRDLYSNLGNGIWSMYSLLNINFFDFWEIMYYLFYLFLGFSHFTKK